MGVTFHASEPLPEEAARAAASLAWNAMGTTPLGRPDRPVDVYITGGNGRRHQLFFLPAIWAVGLTYPVFSTRTIFLRDVDFEAGQLIGAEGPVPDPRDLTYYLVHEMTHLRHAEFVGPIAFLRTPHWVVEGIADWSALGASPPRFWRFAQEGRPLTREHFGSYPYERLCVLEFLNNHYIGHGFDCDALFTLRAPIGALESCPSVQPLTIAAPPGAP